MIGKMKDVSAEMRKKIVELRMDCFTLKEIEELTGVTWTTVRNVLRMCDVTVKRRVWNDESVEELRKMISDGATAKEAGERFGVAESHVRSAAKYYDLGKFGKRRGVWNEERVSKVEQMLMSGMKVGDIARDFGLTKEALYYGMSRAGRSVKQIKKGE